MTRQDSHWSARLTELARSFDESFASASSRRVDERDAYLVVRVGRDRVALSILEIGGLVTGRAILPLPTERPALLGVTGVHARPVPVYSLGILLALAPAPMNPWIVLTREPGEIGLAVDGFLTYLEVERSARHALEGRRDTSRHLGAAIHFPDGALPIVNVPSLTAELIDRSAPAETGPKP